MKYLYLSIVLAMILVACNDNSAAPVFEGATQDTIYVERNTYDTLYLNDTVSITNTDTLVLTEKLLDTLYIQDTVSLNDTTYLKDTVEVEVEVLRTIKDTITDTLKLTDTVTVKHVDTLVKIDTVVVRDTVRLSSSSEAESSSAESSSSEVIPESSSQIESSSSSSISMLHVTINGVNYTTGDYIDGCPSGSSIIDNSEYESVRDEAISLISRDSLFQRKRIVGGHTYTAVEKQVLSLCPSTAAYDTIIRETKLSGSNMVLRDTIMVPYFKCTTLGGKIVTNLQYSEMNHCHEHKDCSAPLCNGKVCLFTVTATNSNIEMIPQTLCRVD